jgi:N-acetylmuramoyl-L-alanine amidase
LRRIFSPKLIQWPLGQALLLGGLLGLCCLLTKPLPMASATTVIPQIQTVHASDTGLAWTFLSNQPLGSAKQFTTLKLPSPYRLIIDVPNAILGKPETMIPVNQHGIIKMELSDTRGRFYSATRITVFVDSAKTLSNLTVTAQESALTLTVLPALAVAKPVATSPLPSDKPPVAKAPDAPVAPLVPTTRPEPTFLPYSSTPANNPPPFTGTILRAVSFQDEQLILKTDAPSGFTVKSTSILTNPKRLVIDLKHASIDNKGQLAPIYPNSATVRSVRVGQFDADTVRLVLETPTPELLGLFYPEANHNTLLVRQAPHKATPPPVANRPSYTPAPSSVGTPVEGQLQNVFLDREGRDTVLRLSSSAPLQFVANRPSPDRLIIDFKNISAQSGWIKYDRGAFPDVRYLKLEGPPRVPSSRLVLDLASGETKAATQLSPDGRLLTVVLSSTGNATSTSAYPDDMSGYGNATLPRQPRIKGQISVVVDAGHGGKDLGANRVGINEKDLNLSVALKLKQALEAKGYKVYLTRSEDVFLPLPEITRISNSIGPDLFVSVHTNSSTNPSINGLETYYYTPQSVPLAQAVHQQMALQVQSPDRGVRRARFYVINHTEVPAILCEMGYISNSTERGSLVTSARQQRTANAIADGVTAYLKAVGLLSK